MDLIEELLKDVLTDLSKQRIDLKEAHTRMQRVVAATRQSVPWRIPYVPRYSEPRYPVYPTYPTIPTYPEWKYWTDTGTAGTTIAITSVK